MMNHYLFQIIRNALGIRCQHGGLIHHSDALQMNGRIESGGIPARKKLVEQFRGTFTGDEGAKDFSLFHIVDYQGRSGSGSM